MKKLLYLSFTAAIIAFTAASCVNTTGGTVASGYQETPYFIASRFLENLRWAFETRNSAMLDTLVSREFAPDAEDLLFEMREQTVNEASVHLWCRIDRILPGRNNEHDVQIRWRKVFWDTGTKTFQRQEGVGNLVLQIQDGKSRLVRRYGNLFF